MVQVTPQARLCPHCANSIPADASKCSYCKRELQSIELMSGRSAIRAGPQRWPLRRASDARWRGSVYSPSDC